MNRREQETVAAMGVELAEKISDERGEDLPSGYWDYAGDVFLDANMERMDELLAQAWFSGFAAQVAPRDNPYVPSASATRPGAPETLPVDTDTTPTLKSAQISHANPTEGTK